MGFRSSQARVAWEQGVSHVRGEGGTGDSLSGRSWWAGLILSRDTMGSISHLQLAAGRGRPLFLETSHRSKALSTLNFTSTVDVFLTIPPFASLACSLAFLLACPYELLAPLTPKPYNFLCTSEVIKNKPGCSCHPVSMPTEKEQEGQRK